MRNPRLHPPGDAPVIHDSMEGPGVEDNPGVLRVMSIGQKVGAGFALSLLTVVLIGMAALWNTRILVSNYILVSHSQVVLERLQDVQSTLLLTEDVAREYVRTSGAGSRVIYERATKDLQRNLRDLTELVSDNSSQRERLKALQELCLLRLEQTHKTLEQADLKGPPSRGVAGGVNPVAPVALEDTRSNSISSVAEAMRREELSLLRVRQGRMDEAASTTRDTILGGTVLAALLVSGVGLAIVRSLTGPLRTLMKGAERLGAGQLSIRLRVASLDEVGRLTEAFNKMAEQLHEDLLQRQAIERALNESLQQASERAQELELRSRESELLGRLVELLQSSTSLEEALHLLGPFCLRLFPNTRGGLFLLGSTRNLLECCASWDQQSATLDDAPPQGGTLADSPRLPSQGGVAEAAQMFATEDCLALRLGRAHRVGPDEPELLCKHVLARPPGETTLCFPLIAQGETLGVLHLAAVRLPETLARNVSEQLALALANLRLRETLRQQSIRDPLTGLFNRRFLEESLDRELARARRNREKLAVLMVDVDHFKSFNDTFGHEAGDLVLQSVGKLLRERIRHEDVACRFGGEEFCLLLPGMNGELALQRAERLREGIASLQIPFGGNLLGPVTASFGLALFPDQATEPNQLFQQADGALYKAKKDGRNRVVQAAQVERVPVVVSP